MNTFLIIGLHPQGLSMLRILSRAGHHVIAFAISKKAVGNYSKYGDKRIFSTIEDLKRQISDITKSSNEKINCIITDGELLGLIISDYPELYEICNVQSGPLPVIKMLSHKNQMYEFASSCGLDHAKYTLLSEYKPGALKFPVILKRNFEISLFFKVMKIDSEKELSVFIRKINQDDYKHIIVQEYISVAEYIFITFQAYLYKGKRKGYFIGTQERRLSVGLTCFLREINNKELRDIIIMQSSSLLSETQYTGFIEIEYLYNPERNKLVFMEVNTRPCGTHSVLNHKFINLSALYNNIKNPPELIENPQLISWINIARDIKGRFQNREFKNLSQFFTSKYDILDWHDLKPFIFQFLNIFLPGSGKTV